MILGVCGYLWLCGYFGMCIAFTFINVNESERG